MEPVTLVMDFNRRLVSIMTIMKDFRLFTAMLATLFVLGGTAYTQDNMGIGTNNPDPSAKLEIESTTQGLLIPRMSEAQRNAIVSPGTGLMIYQTDQNTGTYYYDGAQWRNLSDNLGNHLATQTLDMDTNQIVNVPAPVNGLDAVNKDYVDAAVLSAGGSGGCCSGATEISTELGPFTTATTAFNACATLTQGGNSDWRAPTIDEMVDGLTGDPVIPGVKTANYLWTRSVVGNNGFYRYWAIQLSTGNLSNASGATSNLHIRCVRGN